MTRLRSLRLRLKHLCAAWGLIGRFIDLLVDAVILLSSNKQLFAGFVVITVWWYLFPARFGDTAKGDYPRLVFWYTIIYGTWEGAQKIVQAIQFKRDDHARKLQQQTLESVETIAVDIRRELDRSRERDEAAAIRDEQASMRDSVLIGLVRHLLDLITELIAHFRSV